MNFNMKTLSNGKEGIREKMELDLSGKKAIVTGGGRGLCRSIAEALHDSGAEVILVGSSDSAAVSRFRFAGTPVYSLF